jgi:hypothetical protein
VVRSSRPPELPLARPFAGTCFDQHRWCLISCLIASVMVLREVGTCPRITVGRSALSKITI